MPCNSDYLNPNNRELELQRAAKLYVFLSEQLGKIPPEWAVLDSKDVYCSRDSSVMALCDELRNMNEEQINSIVYNARNKQSRDLADWWEEHEEEDRKREERERIAIEKARNKRFKQWQELNKEFG